MATITAAEKRQLCEHENFINGVTPNGQDGAKTRLTRIEDSLARRDKASNYLIGASISVIVGILLWLLKDVLPALASNINQMSILVK